MFVPFHLMHPSLFSCVCCLPSALLLHGRWAVIKSLLSLAVCSLSADCSVLCCPVLCFAVLFHRREGVHMACEALLAAAATANLLGYMQMLPADFTAFTPANNVWLLVLLIARVVLRRVRGS